MCKILFKKFFITKDHRYRKKRINFSIEHPAAISREALSHPDRYLFHMERSRAINICFEKHGSKVSLGANATELLAVFHF